LGESEDLEPVTCGGPHIDILSASVALDADRLLGFLVDDGSALVVEVEFLRVSYLSGLDDEVVTNYIPLSCTAQSCDN